MSKGYDVPPTYGPPPAAPPSYAQAVGGVPPSAPYIPIYHCKYVDILKTLSWRRITITHKATLETTKCSPTFCCNLIK